MNKLIGLVLLACTAFPAGGQGFPSRPIRIVVPYPPGAVDVYVRLMQPHVEQELGQPFVVDNRPGASGFIGSEIVAHSAPDGHTLLAAASGTLVGAYLVASKAPFDTLKDFTPITTIYNTPSVLVAKPSLPQNSLAELVDFAKRNPGKLSYGSTGIGGSQHIDTESFKLSAGIDLLHVPYNGFAPVVQALLGGQVDVAILTAGVALPLAASNKLKVLAVYGGIREKRPAVFANVPDLSDAYPGYRYINGWIGLFAPAGIPAAVLQRLNTAGVNALHAPEVRAKIEDAGAIAVADSAEHFAATVRGDVEAMGNFIRSARAAGVKFE